MKSSGNGTYFGVSVEYVNRNDCGFVYFGKMIGLDSIALINVIAHRETEVLSVGRRSRVELRVIVVSSIMIFISETKLKVHYAVHGSH